LPVVQFIDYGRIKPAGAEWYNHPAPTLNRHTLWNPVGKMIFQGQGQYDFRETHFLF